MIGHLLPELLIGLLFAISVEGQKNMDRKRNGLIGLVKTVLTETAGISNKSGKWVEGARVLRSIETYDLKGELVEATPRSFNDLGLLSDGELSSLFGEEFLSYRNRVNWEH